MKHMFRSEGIEIGISLHQDVIGNRKDRRAVAAHQELRLLLLAGPAPEPLVPADRGDLP